MKLYISIMAALFCLTFDPGFARADAAPGVSQADEAQLDQIAEGLFANLRAGKTDAGVAQFFGSSSLMSSKVDQLKLLVAQIDSAIGIYGKIGGCEKVDSVSKGSFVQYRTYTCQHTNMLTSWSFAFFKTSRGWIAGNLFFKDQPAQP